MKCSTCGATGRYEQLCNDSSLETTCHGTGFLFCLCAIDHCECCHHGGRPCNGCEECVVVEEWDDDWYEDDDDLYYCK